MLNHVHSIEYKILVGKLSHLYVLRYMFQHERVLLRCIGF